MFIDLSFTFVGIPLTFTILYWSPFDVLLNIIVFSSISVCVPLISVNSDRVLIDAHRLFVDFCWVPLISFTFHWLSTISTEVSFTLLTYHSFVLAHLSFLLAFHVQLRYFMDFSLFPICSSLMLLAFLWCLLNLHWIFIDSHWMFIDFYWLFIDVLIDFLLFLYIIVIEFWSTFHQFFIDVCLPFIGGYWPIFSFCWRIFEFYRCFIVVAVDPATLICSIKISRPFHWCLLKFHVTYEEHGLHKV